MRAGHDVRFQGECGRLAVGDQRLSVVFGTGPLGQATARELLRRGGKVRVVSRRGGTKGLEGAELVTADAADEVSACEACSGAAVIYHCAAPAYTRWPIEFPPLQRGIIEGAASSGAALIYGDNLYMYGPVDGPLTEDLPALARGPNGRTRAAMAAMVMEAHASGKVRAAIGRGSDFFGPGVVQSTMGERVFGSALAGKTAQVLGNPDVPHTYTFIDDFAKGLVTLGEHDEALGEVWHVPSAETLATRRFVELIYETLGAEPRISAAPRFVVSLMAAVSPMMRALKEQLYQFEKPFVADHGKFERAFGVQVTPHEEAIRRTLDWYRSRAAA